MALRSKLYFQKDTLIFILGDMIEQKGTKKRGSPRKIWREDAEED